jgi:hypothetical protein
MNSVDIKRLVNHELLNNVTILSEGLFPTGLGIQMPSIYL